MSMLKKTMEVVQEAAAEVGIVLSETYTDDCFGSPGWAARNLGPRTVWVTPKKYPDFEVVGLNIDDCTNYNSDFGVDYDENTPVDVEKMRFELSDGFSGCFPDEDDFGLCVTADGLADALRTAIDRWYVKTDE